MERNNNITVRQILDFIGSIENYIQGKTFADFENEELLQDGVLRKLELIGEAMKRLTPEFVQKHTDLPFREASDTRNKLIHDYDDVDLKIVWDTITVDLPALKTLLSQIALSE
ncbi:DUF86 domain-containing protein [Candidatus Woesebacteria bacterium]|nr:DUF86 domain-containing protein [Candidatus Woesebacteria bacterium]